VLSEEDELDLLLDKLTDGLVSLTDEEFYRFFELLGERRQEELCNEVSHTAYLVANQVVEPNIFNTYEWLNNCVEQLKDPLTPTLVADLDPDGIEKWVPTPVPSIGLNIVDDSHRGFEVLEYFGKQLSKEALEATESEPMYRQTPVYPTPVEEFLGDMRRGWGPAPELLLSISNSFDLYFESGGELTLEEVFFGKHKADDIRAKRRKNHFRGISFQEFDFSFYRGGESQEELALRFFQNHMNENPELNLVPEQVGAFLKKYRRWKRGGS
jgi:hypothetical protein